VSLFTHFIYHFTNKFYKVYNKTIEDNEVKILEPHNFLSMHRPTVEHASHELSFIAYFGLYYNIFNVCNKKKPSVILH